MYPELLEDINDRKFRFHGNNDNVIIIWNNPRPKYVVILGSHIEQGIVMYSAYVKLNGAYKIKCADGDTLITSSSYHFYEDELDIMSEKLESSDVIGDILSNNLIESAIELEEFKMEYYLA